MFSSNSVFLCVSVPVPRQEALSKFQEVTHNHLDFARELQKSFLALGQDVSKPERMPLTNRSPPGLCAAQSQPTRPLRCPITAHQASALPNHSPPGLRAAQSQPTRPLRCPITAHQASALPNHSPPGLSSGFKLSLSLSLTCGFFAGRSRRR